MPHICASALLSSHKKPVKTAEKIMNKNAERIRRFLILLRRSGSLLADLINFTKYTMRKINEIIGSAIKTEIEINRSGSHSKYTSGVRVHKNAIVEIIRNFLSLLWRSGSFFDLINLIKHTTSQTKQIQDSAIMGSISDLKLFIFTFKFLMYKAAF